MKLVRLKPEIQINVDLNKMTAAQVSFNDITRPLVTKISFSSAGTLKLMVYAAVLILSRILKMPTKCCYGYP
jgi:hypothetical protein